MPQVIFSSGALNNLKRLREFLRPKSPAAAERAGVVIAKAIVLLEQHPHLGRVVEGTSGKVRDLSIPFGHGGYVARYVFESEHDICGKPGFILNIEGTIVPRTAGRTIPQPSVLPET